MNRALLFSVTFVTAIGFFYRSIATPITYELGKKGTFSIDVGTAFDVPYVSSDETGGVQFVGFLAEPTFARIGASVGNISFERIVYPNWFGKFSWDDAQEAWKDVFSNIKSIYLGKLPEAKPVPDAVNSFWLLLLPASLMVLWSATTARSRSKKVRV